MRALGSFYRERQEHVQALKWYTTGAEAGLPRAMFSLGCSFEAGEGMAAPDYPAAVSWYRRAAEAGNGMAANNLAACMLSAAASRSANGRR